MFTRLVALGTGLLVGVAAGILLADGTVGPLGVAAVSGIAVTALLLRLIRDPAQRSWLLKVVLLALALRLAVAVVLYTAIQAGGGEWITGDDGEYAHLAWGLAQYVRAEPEPPYEPPYWDGATYLFGTYVYVVAALYLVFGPGLLVPSVANAGFAAATLVLLFDLARRVFGQRPARIAVLIVAFYPSLVLWSSLNLKEALAGLLVIATLWSVVSPEESARARSLVVAYAILWPMESLRRYLFAGLALVVPLGVWLAPNLRRASRLRLGTLATGLSAALLALSPVAGLVSVDPFATFEAVRVDMSRSARTGFVDQPLAVSEGDTFVVSGEPAAAGAPRIIVVPPDARIVALARSTPTGTPSTTLPVRRQLVRVYPGDIVVVGRADSTPAPTEKRHQLSAQDPIQFRPARTEDDPGSRTVEHLPSGLIHALFAPFPWASSRTLDLLTVPEMLVWYALLVSAALSITKDRLRWRQLTPLVAYVGGTMLIYALAEGNVGTLFRHRGMVIPTTAILAAPTIAALMAGVRALSPFRAARLLPSGAPD